MSKNDVPTRHAEPQRKTAVTIGDTVFAVLDRLAGEGNNIKVDFERLTVGFGGLQATVDGAVVLDVELAK